MPHVDVWLGVIVPLMENMLHDTEERRACGRLDDHPGDLICFLSVAPTYTLLVN